MIRFALGLWLGAIALQLAGLACQIANLEIKTGNSCYFPAKQLDFIFGDPPFLCKD